MAMDFDIVGGFNAESNPQLDGQRTINMYVEVDEQAKKPKALATFPGHKAKILPSEGSVVRSLFTHKDSLYDVSSNNIYKIDNAFNPTKINASIPLSTSAGYIGTAANSNNEIIFVDGTGGKLYKNLDNTFSNIIDPNFPLGATDVAFFDGFFIANVGGTNEFRLSNPNNGMSWTFENQPRKAFLASVADVIVGFASLHNRLYVFGQFSTELWYNAGQPTVPFRPDKNVLLDYGLAAVNSIATGHQLLFWLTRSNDGLGTVVMTDGSTPMSVSTRPLELEFQSYSKTDDAVGFVIKIAGHIFYYLAFPTVGKTWIYDVGTKLWFELEAQGGLRYAANCHTYFNGKHFIGDYKSRNIYEISENYYDHNGVPFRWKRVSRHFSDPSYKHIRINRIQVDTIKGQADPTGINATPEIFLATSRNGGVTFGHLQRKTYTKIGEYKSRCIWWGQGISDDFVFSLEGYNSLPFMIMGGTIDAEVLRS